MAKFGFGVISSISCGQAFTEAFERAVTKAIGGGSDPAFTYFDQVGYDRKLLDEAVAGFSADGNIAMIVTFGGRIAFEAANSSNSKPFISLLGDVPVAKDRCFGGVSTDSYARNQPRPLNVTFQNGVADVKEPTNSLAVNDTVAFTAGTTGTLPANVTAGRNYTVSSPGAGTFQFKDGVNTVTPNANGTGFAWGSSWNNRVAAIKKTLGKTPDNVSLIYHTGSPLVKSEIQLWTGGGDSGAWPKVTGFFDNGPGGAAIPFSSKRGFANAFNSITTDVIVISADPHFQENKDDLIQAANQSSKIVCYPYADYRNRGGTHKPRPGMSYLYGPSLKDMIDQMGTIAGTFGKNNPAPPYAPVFTPVTDGYGANLRQL